MPLGCLSRFSRHPPIALSGDIWDVPSLDKESKDKNKDKNKSKSKSEDENKDKNKNENKDEDKNENNIPTSKLK